uniref:CFA20 domain-containing protein n=1 Tax=Oryzias latipes TaxID=8090 RepID=A0A3B3H984_ORYLA
MIRQAYQVGFFSVLSAVGGHPFQNWQVQVDKRVVASLMCFQTPPSCSTTYITCPTDPTKIPGIKSPFLVLILKTTEMFSFEVQISDNRNVRWWLKWSTIHKEKKVDHFRANLPFQGDGWRRLVFDLQNITNTSFGSSYIETLRIQICGREASEGIWIRRVYFTDREYSEDEIFKDFKLPLPQRAKVSSVYILDWFWVPSELKIFSFFLQK